jgi:hypothetical protein
MLPETGTSTRLEVRVNLGTESERIWVLAAPRAKGKKPSESGVEEETMVRTTLSAERARR